MKSSIVSTPMTAFLTFVLLATITTIGMTFSYIDAQKSNFKKYENKDYNVTIDYPSKWKKSENNLAQNQIVTFSAPEIEQKESSVLSFILIPAKVALASQQTPSSNMTLENFTNYFIDSAYSGPDEYKIIKTSKTGLAGNEAVELLMYEYLDDKTSKVKRVISLGDNDTAYMIKYAAEPGKFSEYLPIVQQMIDSFQPTTSLKNKITTVDETTEEKKVPIEIPTMVPDSNLIAKSDEMTSEINDNTGVIISHPDETETNTANNTSSNFRTEQLTLKAQINEDDLLDGWYDIKKFRLALSEGSEICPSNNCEYRVQDGKIFSLGDSSYTIDGKLKVTIPQDDSSKSKLYPLGMNLDLTGEEETNGQTIQNYDGTFSIGPDTTYVVTNATLEVDKKNPVLTIQAERGSQNSTSSE